MPLSLLAIVFQLEVHIWLLSAIIYLDYYCQAFLFLGSLVQRPLSIYPLLSLNVVLYIRLDRMYQELDCCLAVLVVCSFWFCSSSICHLQARCTLFNASRPTSLVICVSGACSSL